MSGFQLSLCLPMAGCDVWEGEAAENRGDHEAQRVRTVARKGPDSQCGLVSGAAVDGADSWRALVPGRVPVLSSPCLS